MFLFYDTRCRNRFVLFLFDLCFHHTIITHRIKFGFTQVEVWHLFARPTSILRNILYVVWCVSTSDDYIQPACFTLDEKQLVCESKQFLFSLYLSARKWKILQTDSGLSQNEWNTSLKICLCFKTQYLSPDWFGSKVSKMNSINAISCFLTPAEIPISILLTITLILARSTSHCVF